MKCTVCGTQMAALLTSTYCPREDQHGTGASNEPSYGALRGFAEGWLGKSCRGLPTEVLPERAPHSWETSMYITSLGFVWVYHVLRGYARLYWEFSSKQACAKAPSTPSPPPAATP